MNKFVLLIHGPFSEYAVRSLGKHETLFDSIFISAYKEDEKEWLPFSKSGKLVLSDDVSNPGAWNVNRQLNLVSAGLSAIDIDAIVLKLRSDQRVHFGKVIRLLNKNYETFASTPKYLTTNCFTRVDRLYHPSDMFIAG